MYDVVWPPNVLRELAAIAVFIRVDDPAAAERIVSDIRAAGQSLDHFPRRGRPAPQGTRELPTVPPYIIRYEVVGDTVTILSIRPGARRPLD